jgi:hypothetical protein
VNGYESLQYIKINALRAAISHELGNGMLFRESGRILLAGIK